MEKKKKSLEKMDMDKIKLTRVERKRVYSGDRTSLYSKIGILDKSELVKLQNERQILISQKDTFSHEHQRKKCERRILQIDEMLLANEGSAEMTEEQLVQKKKSESII